MDIRKNLYALFFSACEGSPWQSECPTLQSTVYSGINAHPKVINETFQDVIFTTHQYDIGLKPSIAKPTFYMGIMIWASRHFQVATYQILPMCPFQKLLSY